MTAHSRNHWIKLYVEINDDPKIGLLPVNARWRFISALALAGELGEGGFLPPVDDELAYRLHTEVETLQAEMRMLAGRGLAELRMHGDGQERWFLTHFAERQAPSPNAERQRQWRHRQSNADSNAPVTNRYANVTPETETETEREGEAESDVARATTPQARPAPKKSPPPPKVQSRIPDRTPAGFQATSGYHPPPEPEPPQPDPVQVQAIGEMANAITDVTGISARLNWSDPKGNGNSVGDLAADLVANGYTPEQIRDHYGQRKVAELWHWYESDWRGKRGDRPRLKEIRETIAGAVSWQSPEQLKQENGGQSWVERSIELARRNGLLPQPQTG